jgi:peptidoglycan/xylan/chitin deacetylase (PgdA/CDA1 family)
MGTIKALASIKSLARRWAAELYTRSAGFPRQLRGKVAILQYHRVVTPDDLSLGYIEPGMYVLHDVFEMQVRWLSERFEILSFSQLLARWNANDWDERKSYCVLTFDDGWLDNYRHAFPILKKYKVPATIFLPTDYIGSNEWFWTEKIPFLLTCLDRPRVTSTQRNRVGDVIAELPLMHPEIVGQEGISGTSIEKIIGQCKLLPPSGIESLLNRLSEILEVSIPHERVTMNWNEVTEMAKNGISFGSHSCSHQLLTQLNEETIRQELEESNRVLRTLPIGYIPVFCYPNGDNNYAIQDLVKQSQYVAAVGTRSGAEGKRPENIYELNRIGMHNDVTETVPLLAFHLFRAVLSF